VQSVFYIILDVPMEDSHFTDFPSQPLVLGSVWFEYEVRLAKPTIAKNFVGTSSRWTNSGTWTLPNTSAVSVFSDPAGTDLTEWIQDQRSNDGTSLYYYFSGATPLKTRALICPPGIYNATVQFDFNLVSGNEQLVWSLYGSPTPGGTFSPLSDGEPSPAYNYGLAGSGSSVYGMNAIIYTSSTTPLPYAGRTNQGMKFLIPAGPSQYVQFFLRTASGPMTISNITFSLACPFSSPESVAAISSLDEEEQRITALEKKLATLIEEKLADRESKDERKLESRSRRDSIESDYDSEMKSPRSLASFVMSDAAKIFAAPSRAKVADGASSSTKIGVPPPPSLPRPLKASSLK